MNLYQIFQPMLLKSMHPLIWQHINLNTILLKHFFTSKMRQIIFIITHRLKIYQLLKHIDQGFFREACICIKRFLSKRKLKTGNPNIIKIQSWYVYVYLPRLFASTAFKSKCGSYSKQHVLNGCNNFNMENINQQQQDFQIL